MLKITLAFFIFCFIVERLFAGWRLPSVSTWYTRVILINVVQLGIVLVAGFTWEKWLSGASVLHLSQHMGSWGSGFVAYFIATFVFYWWHRLRHQSDFFWRGFHQIHHSPQRLEVITSFYKHPQEMIANSILGSLLVYSFLGLTLKAGAIYTLFTALGEFFYHTNIKTPRWIGLLFQRPEMHRIHHQMNRHKNNYGDFVIWDMLFGTYENPKEWSGRCGFTENRELKLKDMFHFKDVHRLLVILIPLVLLWQPNRAHAQQKDFQSWDEACMAVQAVVNEGDLIFLDIPEYVFRKVAKATNTWTSHVGIAFKGKDGRWLVKESAIPLSKNTELCDYLSRSSKYLFEIKRLNRPLTRGDVERLRATANSMLGKFYNLGFNFDSQKFFCSKFTYLSYRSIGIEVGKLQTFEELLKENPDTDSLTFWKFWFFGSIPWQRRTVTPASQLLDEDFVRVVL